MPSEDREKCGGATLMAGILLSLCVPTLGIAVQNGFLPLSFEGSALLLNYLTVHRPLPNMVFDPLNNDWGLYQARELSYLFDYLDAQFIRLSAKAGVGHFLSLSYYLSITGIVLLIHCVWRRLFDGLSHFMVSLACLLLLSSPFLFLGGTFFRSSKMLCSFSLALICAALLALYRRQISKPAEKFLVATVAISCLFMSLMDRQGVFFSLLLCVGVGLTALAMAFKERSRPGSLESGTCKTLTSLALSLFGVLLFDALYNHLLAPHAIFHFNGYWPDFSFQRMGFMDVFNFRGGLPFLFGGMGIFACNSGMTGGLALGLLIGLGLLSPLLSRRKESWRERFKSQEAHAAIQATLAYAFVLSGMLLSANLMTAKHPELLWRDVIRSVYFAPNAIAILFFLLFALDSAVKSFKGNLRLKFLAPLLALFAIGNVIALPNALETLRTGHIAVEMSFTPEAIYFIRNPSRDCHLSFLSYLHLDLIRALREDQNSKGK